MMEYSTTSLQHASATESGTAQHTTPRRKVYSPGATQAAISRISEIQRLRMEESAHDAVYDAAHNASSSSGDGGGDGDTHNASVPSSSIDNAFQRNGSSFQALKSDSESLLRAKRAMDTPQEMVRKCRRKMPSPGATQRAIARLQQIRPSTESGEDTFLDAHGDDEPNKYKNEVVWAKMPSYPWWPAQVSIPTDGIQSQIKHSKTDRFVIFFGACFSSCSIHILCVIWVVLHYLHHSCDRWQLDVCMYVELDMWYTGTNDYAWLPSSSIKPFVQNNPFYTKCASLKNKSLQEAIDHVWLYLGQHRPDLRPA